MMPYRENVPVNPDEALTRETLRGELLDGEHLLWAQRPRRGLVFDKGDIAISIFMLLWTGFACFWTLVALVAGGRLMAAFGLPFVAVGIYMLVGRFFVEARVRARTFYGITDHRVLIVSVRPRVVSEYALMTMTRTSVEEKSAGFGDIYLASQTYLDRRGRQKYATPAMPQVPCASEVHRILREAIDARRALP